MESKFTWFPKLTATVAKVPEEQRHVLLWALVEYGTYGIEPALEYPLDAIFESLREDIDNSKRSIQGGQKGGRNTPKAGCGTHEPPLRKDATPPVQVSNPPCTDDEKTSRGVDKESKGGYENLQPKPIQTIPNHTNKKREAPTSPRFVPPTVDEVRAYCRSKGYNLDAEAFVAFYESKGWVVGKSRMKSWKAACTTWAKRRQADSAPKEVATVGDRYSVL